jgi:hypothetical protein
MNNETNEQLTTALAEAVNKTVSAVETASDFLAQQSPEVIEQLLRWGFASSFMCFALYVGLAAFTLAIIVKFTPGDISQEISFDNVAVVSMLCNIAFGMMVVMVARSLDWIKILIAPKVWLLEYAATIVN